MSGFVKRTAIFVLPFMAGAIALFYLPYNKYAGYLALDQHCRTGAWFYHRVVENPEPIDLAIFGTSRVMTGIMDDSLEYKLSRSLGRPYRVANLGFCRPGRTMHYALIKELLRYKKPEAILLDVRMQESRFSHPDFGYIADGSDVLFPYLLINQNLPRDWETALKHRFLTLRNLMLAIPLPADTSKRERLHSFDHAHAGYPALKPGEGKTLRPMTEPGSLAYRWKVEGEMNLAAHYLSKISELCRAKGVRLYLLYIPDYPDHLDKAPFLYDRYLEMGVYLRPPDSLFTVAGHYGDPDHLNDRGALLLTEWLAGALRIRSGQALGRGED